MVHVQIPQWVARFNKYVTNPVQRVWAGYVPAMAVLEHVAASRASHTAPL
jgi:hypothetical protein